MLWQRGLLSHTDRLPALLRVVGRRFLLRDDAGYRERLATSQEPLPSRVERRVWQDAERLRRETGDGRLAW